MLVRRASREEVDRLNAIAMEAKAHWGYEPAQLEEWRPGLLTQPESIDRWPTFVAVVHGQAVGFTQANPERSPWELVSLWVLPAFMGRGIGKALLQRICRAAAAAQESSLDIDADPNAEPFYRACGAVTIGVAAAPIRGEPSRVRPQMRLNSSAALPIAQAKRLMKARAACSSDFAAVLLLNRESERFLSPLSREQLEQLHHQADLHQVLEVEGEVGAFVLALREGTSYDSVNYRWFIERYERFLYVDRVVVSVALHGRGLGRVLYEFVFAHARATRAPVVTCEYDIEPPNLASERFHQAFGFEEVGSQLVAGGKKRVSLQAASVGCQAAHEA